MTRRARIITIVLLALMAAGGLYLRVLARRVTVEPPRHGEELAQTRLSEAALESVAGPRQTVTLYFPDARSAGLVTERRDMPWATNQADQMRLVLLALIEGSDQGYARVLPPSTKIRAAFLLDGGHAYVDLSSDFRAGLSPGIASECRSLYSIVNSLSDNIHNIMTVKILVDGQEVETLGGHADLTASWAPVPTPTPPSP